MAETFEDIKKPSDRLTRTIIFIIGIIFIISALFSPINNSVFIITADIACSHVNNILINLLNLFFNF